MTTSKAPVNRAEIDRLIAHHTGLRESASPVEFAHIRSVASALLLRDEPSEVPAHAITEIAVVCAVKAFIKANLPSDGATSHNH